MLLTLKEISFNWAILSALLGTAIFFKKVNFILSVSCNKGNKLKVTLQFSLAKGTFN